MRDTQRIERKQRAAINQHAEQQHREFGLAEQGGKRRRNAAHHRHRHDHHAAVEPVGQAPDRILQHQRAKHRCRHEIADLAVVEADGQAIDRAHAEHHRHRHAVQPQADHRQR